MKLFTRDAGFSPWAGVITWALVSGITLYIVWFAAGRYAGLFGWALALQVVYLAGMLLADCGRPQVPSVRAAFAIQLAAALALGWMVPLSFLPIYTIIWLAMAPQFFTVRACYVLLAALGLIWYVILDVSHQDDDALLQVLLFGTFHYFALLSSTETLRAGRKTQEAEALNRELRATQHLLAEASRQGERTRIARDLHDLLGHHLTALTIKLQVAGRVAEGATRDEIEQCHALAKLLLSDVREAVSTLREQSALDFSHALQLIVDNVPGVTIHLDVEDTLTIDDIDVAESLLRCVQEAITNVLRHSRAAQCWIRVWRHQQRINVEIRDNGTVALPLRWGNGLTGMRERIERINGKLTVDTPADALRIMIHVPVS